jgi:hypothetical protein
MSNIWWGPIPTSRKQNADSPRHVSIVVQHDCFHVGTSYDHRRCGRSHRIDLHFDIGDRHAIGRLTLAVVTREDQICAGLRHGSEQGEGS